jgi:hypothetical protein
MNEELIKSHIINVITEVNAKSGNLKLSFSQQQVITKHMSICGGIGRLRIKPTTTGFDVSLAGKSLTNIMSPYMIKLMGKGHDGFNQTDCNPYWKTNDLSVIESAITEYAKTVT